MAADLVDTSPQFQRLLDLASELTGADLKRICFRGPERELVKTEVLQPLLVAVCLGYHGKLVRVGVRPDIALGHSLGEIAALACAGVINEEDAVRIAAERGRLMAAAAREYPGGMLAVVSPERNRILAALAPVLKCGNVVSANDNAPGQWLLSGTSDGLEEAATLLLAAKLPCRRISVAGPWHSPLMARAQAEFSAWLRQLPMHAPAVPLIMNVTGRFEQEPDRIRDLLARNLTEPVQWRESMRCLLDSSPRALFEIGPGRVLSGLARANGVPDSVRIFNVNGQRGLVLVGVWLASTTGETAPTHPAPGPIGI